MSSVFSHFALIGDTVNNLTNTANKINYERIPTNEKLISWLFTQRVEELNSGLPRTNSDRGRVEDLKKGP